MFKLEQITTKISNIVFSNTQSGFYIFKATDDRGSSFSVKGQFPALTFSQGMKVNFTGEWTTHPKYGKQFNASKCELVKENGKAGVVSYLIAHVPSIGPITANKLYDHFGDELINVFEQNPEKIQECEFLTKPQIESIIHEWSKSSAQRSSVIFLSELGLTQNQVRSVFTEFGVFVRDMINKNPYILTDCAGVGFVIADLVARKLGLGPDDPRRIRSLVTQSLHDLSFDDGHVYALSHQIKDNIKKMFRKNNLVPFSHGEMISESLYLDALMVLEKAGEITIRDHKIYSEGNWMNESDSSISLARILGAKSRKLSKFDECLKDFEKKKKITLSDDQKNGFYSLKDSKVCVISGYPGTGKTTLMSLFVHLFEKNNLDYALLAPTGIAAKRLNQLTGKSAYTIHRALGCARDGNWEHNSTNKYRVDAVICDESSMININTFYHLVTALPDDVIVIFVGDNAQLPSVGAGSVLKNLLDCPDIPNIQLTKIYRQESQNEIISVAHKILNNEFVDTKFNKDSEFLFLNMDSESSLEEICKLSSALKLKEANFQVISPMYGGELGVDNLNKKLRPFLNPSFANEKASKIRHGEADLYEGDRILITKNDYERMIFNGDTGKITRISIKNNLIETKIFNWFDSETNKYVDKTFNFSMEESKIMIRVAYACTVHRSQSQEFDYVIIPMSMNFNPMLYKNLIYTAITRAKKKCFIFGDSNAFRYAIQNERENIRNSDLYSLISLNLLLEKSTQVMES